MTIADGLSRGALGRAEPFGARLGRALFWPASAALLVALALLARQTYLISAIGAANPGKPETAQPEVEAAFPWSTLLVALMALTALAYWLPRRAPQTDVAFALIAAGSVVVVTLGVATYLPCTSEQAWYAPIAWVFGLFTGQYEFSPAPPSNCATTWAPGLELARALGVVVTGSTALKLIHDVARSWVDRWVVALSGDVDVVAGLTATSLPLVGALLEESARARRLPPWVDTRPPWWSRAVIPATRPDYPRRQLLWWRITGLRPGDLRRMVKARPRVVVIDPDADNALLAEARRLGARVVVGDAADPKLLRLVLTRWAGPASRRTALRRCFAVEDDQRRNLAIWAATVETVTGPPAGEYRAHLDDVVPRAFVLLEEAREARQWRVNRFASFRAGRGVAAGLTATPTLISDSITLDGMVAEQVARRILPDHVLLSEDHVVSRIVIVGEGPTSLTLLDELAWQLWCRYEIAQAAGRGHLAAEPKLVEITLSGPTASRRQAEWEQVRAPWRYPPGSGFVGGHEAPTDLRMFCVTAAEGDPEDVASRVLSEDPEAVVVFVDDSEEYAAAAARLSRLHGRPDWGSLRVMLRTSGAVAGEPITPGGLLRFAPELVLHDDVLGPRAPIDSVARLAEQQHAVYRAETGFAELDAVARGELGSPSTDRFARKVTGRRWTASSATPIRSLGEPLPEFYREDNVRQHWRILSWAVEHGYVWESVTHADADRNGPPHDWASDLDAMVSAEYMRWAQLRRDHGWWAVGGSEPDAGDGALRDDSLRLHPELRGEEFISHDFNSGLIRMILHRLWASGLAAVRP